MVKVYLVLLGFKKVFLCHLAYGIGFIDDVILTPLVSAVNGIVGSHNDTSHDAFILVSNGVHLECLVFCECKEISIHSRCINE